MPALRGMMRWRKLLSPVLQRYGRFCMLRKKTYIVKHWAKWIKISAGLQDHDIHFAKNVSLAFRYTMT
jgi:hypothetical protein